MNEQAIIAEMMRYINTTLEQAHATFGDFPICPFVRQARLNHKVEFFVYPFESQDILNSNSRLFVTIHDFSQNPNHDVLVVIHPDPEAFDFPQFQSYLNQLNAQLHAAKLVAFGGHPQDLFNVQGVRTRQDPFINFTIQSKEKLEQASTQLLKTDYYKNWSADNLRSIRSL